MVSCAVATVVTVYVTAVRALHVVLLVLPNWRHLWEAGKHSRVALYDVVFVVMVLLFLLLLLLK